MADEHNCSIFPTITTTEMHTGGEPLRIVDSGYSPISGQTILAKRRYAEEKLNHLRKFLMFEPRGHYDMYGALLVPPDHPEADLAVLFMHNAGYSTMCGHAVIALGRYAVDKGLVTVHEPETRVNIQCPCGLVEAFVQCQNGVSGSVRFRSVPAFAFALDVEVIVASFGKVKVDIGYGGAFYALVSAEKFGLSVESSKARDLVDVADQVTEAVRLEVKVSHPDDPDLAFIYGTILTDGKDSFQSDPTSNVCVFADREVDRSPTGSGVTARLAVQHARGLIDLNQTRTFRSLVGSEFTGSVVRKLRCGDFNAVIVEVAGQAFYSGTCSFTKEERDSLGQGFLVR